MSIFDVLSGSFFNILFRRYVSDCDVHYCYFIRGGTRANDAPESGELTLIFSLANL